MGRTTQAKDIQNRPPVVMNSRSGGYPFETTVDTRSATASLTALALTGPGVVSLLALSMVAPQRIVTTVYVDGVKAFSASGATTVLSAVYYKGIIGGFHTTGSGIPSAASFEEIPFNDSFLALYAMPDMSGAPSFTIYYNYRLTE